MSRNEWNALVECARKIDLRKILDHYGIKLEPAWKGAKSEFVGACPICGTGNDRFSVNFKKEVFNCRVCAKGGKGSIDLEMFLTGVEFVEAVKALTDITSPSGLRTSDAEAEARSKQRQREQADAEAAQHGKAAWLWKTSRPAAGSIVSTYLKARGYVENIPATVRYLPARESYAPAMIAAYAEPDEREPYELARPKGVRAVHLTKLLPDGSDRVREKAGKIIIGRPLGKPIAVSPITDGLSLVITEGIEDALAYAATGYGAWAAGSASHLAPLALTIPDYVETVIIEQHADETGEQNTKKLVQTLREREREGRQQGLRPERAMEIIIVCGGQK
jgi:CHC2 zinc finger/Toprim domain